jgi:hypothetical protein
MLLIYRFPLGPRDWRNWLGREAENMKWAFVSKRKKTEKSKTFSSIEFQKV